MIHNGLRADHATEQEKPGQHSFWILAVTALATSIDALAVGVGLAFVDVNIFPPPVPSAGHHDHGHPRHHARPGARRSDRQARGDGRRVVLILVGATILYEHLSAA